MNSESGLVLEWFHPSHCPETLSVATNSYFRGFRLGDDLQGRRVAIRLPEAADQRLIHTIGAYFVAADGISAESWAHEAAFSWSVYSDSSGLPGSPRTPVAHWDLGENPSLRSGGWAKDTVNWLLAADQGPHWLVGEWPDAPTEIALLGADSEGAIFRTLVGYLENGNERHWQEILDPGLMVEIVTLFSAPCPEDGDSVGLALPESDSTLAEIAFAVIAEVISGPLSPWFDTSFVLPFNGLRKWDSSAAVGQTYQYNVATVCGSDTSVWSATAPVSIEPVWPLILSPSQIVAEVETGSMPVFEIDLYNPGSDTLSVVLEALITLIDNDLSAIAGDLTMAVVISPDSLLIPSGGSASVVLRPVMIPQDPGVFSGFLRLRSKSTIASAFDNHIVTVRLHVDSKTFVGQEDNALGTSGSTGSRLSARAMANPFTDEITLLVDLEFSGAGATGSFDRAGDPSLSTSGEVVIFDLLGRQHAVAPFPAIDWSSSESGHAIVVISGTARWPSGVYFCRVRYGPLVHVIKLLHLR